MSLGDRLDQAAKAYLAGHMDEARRGYLESERLAPGDPRATYSLAVMDLRAGRHEAARMRLRAVEARLAGHYELHHNLGVAEQALGGWAAAARAYDAALRIRPEAVETAFNLAIALAVVGGVDEAIRLYRDLAARPGLGLRAATRLAILSPEATTDAEMAILDRATADDGVKGEAKVAGLFALAACLEARARFDEAFEAYAAANAAKRKQLDAGPEAFRPTVAASDHEQSVLRVTMLFDVDFLSRHGGGGDRTARPIFLVGMPRSGTSLVERILGSHPDVQGMGESDALASVVNGRFPYPPNASLMDNHFAKLAAAYLAAQRPRGWNGRSRPVDKTLDNHLHIGLIDLMFPQAVIIHVRRAPMAVGLACWRQLFAAGNETLYDLADIGAEILRHERVMAHWGAVAPGRVKVIDYEALVANPSDEIRRLVTDLCGLNWSPACLDFHGGGGATATASAAQVRRPIFTDAASRHQAYARHLRPLATALEIRPVGYQRR